MSMSSAVLRREHSFEITDNMPPQLRACVHEYGFAIVYVCLKHKISSPAAIHDLVREIWEGARQPSQRRAIAGTLDWVLLQAGAEINAARLRRVLLDNNLFIVPRNPTRRMLAASMATVSGFNQRVTKEEKHRLRLIAAIAAAE